MGQTRPVLFESEEKDGFMFGFTDNYIKVKHPWDERLVNAIRPVRLEREDPDGTVFCSLP